MHVCIFGRRTCREAGPWRYLHALLFHVRHHCCFSTIFSPYAASLLHPCRAEATDAASIKRISCCLSILIYLFAGICRVYTYNDSNGQSFVSVAQSSGDATGSGLPQR